MNVTLAEDRFKNLLRYVSPVYTLSEATIAELIAGASLRRLHAAPPTGNSDIAEPVRHMADCLFGVSTFVSTGGCSTAGLGLKSAVEKVAAVTAESLRLHGVETYGSYIPPTR